MLAGAGGTFTKPISKIITNTKTFEIRSHDLSGLKIAIPERINSRPDEESKEFNEADRVIWQKIRTKSIPVFLSDEGDIIIFKKITVTFMNICPRFLKKTGA